MHERRVRITGGAEDVLIEAVEIGERRFESNRRELHLTNEELDHLQLQLEELMRPVGVVAQSDHRRVADDRAQRFHRVEAVSMVRKPAGRGGIGDRRPRCAMPSRRG